MSKSAKILMVEDSASLSAMYKAYLSADKYHISAVESIGRAHAVLGAFVPDIVLLDIELPDGNGMDFLQEIMTLERPPQVIVMTAHGTSSMAVEAVRLGAFDFLTKPFDAARLQVTVDNAAATLELGNKVSELAHLQRDHYGSFIGRSAVMQSVYKTLDSLAQSSATAFIVGESGTGKELAAEAIHRYSKRSEKSFIAINCGSIPGELMESELFGHVKGAFTGASTAREGAVSVANGGTLFLDEICEMDLELQKKLLRFIQTGTYRKVGSDKLEEVDVRFVCATNRDPLREVREGRFREDLFYRLHVVPVRMPPLREREDDILLIARQFLKDFSEREEKSFKKIDTDAEERIRRYPWPGNVRQLQNTLHRVIVLNQGEAITAQMLPDSVVNGHIESEDDPISTGATAAISPTASKKIAPEAAPHQQRREQIEPLWLVEKRTIKHAIDICNGNVNQAAGLLEVAPSTLYRKLQSWKDKPS